MSYVQTDPLQSKLDKFFPSMLTVSLPMFHSILSPNTVHSSSSLKRQFLCVFYSSITQLSCRSNGSFPITIWQNGITIVFYTIVFYTITILCNWASLVAQRVKSLPAMRDTRIQSLGWEDPLEKEMATHSSTLAWKIPWTEKPGRLQSMGLQRVRHY